MEKETDCILSLMMDLMQKMQKGIITPEKLARFLNVTDQNQLVRDAAKLLSARFGRPIEVDSLPAWFTDDNLALAANFNLRPIFLPDEEITEDRPLKSWIKPEKWFYKKIKEGSIASDSAKLKSGWYLADFTLSVDYQNGAQVYLNDPLASIIKKLREQGEIGKYNNTPINSRFLIKPDSEWLLVFAELSKELGLTPNQIFLERAIEFNAIGNIYDKNRGKFNTWEWFADIIGGSGRLCGGSCGGGGLAGVSCSWGDCRGDGFAGRPLVSFFS